MVHGLVLVVSVGQITNGVAPQHHCKMVGWYIFTNIVKNWKWNDFEDNYLLAFVPSKPYFFNQISTFHTHLSVDWGFVYTKWTVASKLWVLE